jgi:hypothetical protein
VNGTRLWDTIMASARIGPGRTPTGLRRLALTDADREMRELFARLKEEDRAHTPSFDATLAAGLARRVSRHSLRRHTWALSAVAAAAAIVVAVLLRSAEQGAGSQDQPHRSPLRSPPARFAGTRAVAWSFPTDFLLKTPGSDLLRSIPTFETTILRSRNRS